MNATIDAPARIDRIRISATNAENRVSTLARFALANSPYAAVSLLDCQVIDGVIVLSGVLPSYYLKQIAQELLLRLDCGLRIENRVEVIA